MAKWSKNWEDEGLTRWEKTHLSKKAAFTPASKPVKKEGGKYPHLQKAKFDYGRPPKVYKNNPKKEALS